MKDPIARANQMRVEAERQACIDAFNSLNDVYERVKRAVPTHPNNCAEDECMICGYRDCPYDELLHYHHDGCPSCWGEEEEP